MTIRLKTAMKADFILIFFIEFRVKTRLRNHRLYRHQSYHLHHEMFLLRARLVHAVNAVNNFVLTTVGIGNLNKISNFDILVSYSW
jgi:hypothetical protein